jgi:uncharacterized protein (TIGR02466 family)
MQLVSLCLLRINMSNRFEVIPLAGIPIFVKDLSRTLTSDERNFLENLDEVKLPYGNYISKSKTILEETAFNNLKSDLQKELEIYTKEVLKIKQDFYITDSWATRNPKDSSHHSHMHPNSIFSGVYYIDVPDGDLEFHHYSRLMSKDFNFEYDITEWNIFNSFNWAIKPNQGTIVIFPSWLRHRAKENLSNENRRIIGFNSFVKGNFGTEDAINRVTIK